MHALRNAPPPKKKEDEIAVLTPDDFAALQRNPLHGCCTVVNLKRGARPRHITYDRPAAAYARYDTWHNLTACRRVLVLPIGTGA